jgi:hypothetical protein
MTTIIAYSIFGIAACLALARPAWAFALIITMYAFEQLLQSSGGIFLAIPSLTNVTVAGCAGVAAVGCFLRTPRPFAGYLTPALVGSVAILTWSALSLLWTPSFTSASDYVRGGLPYAFLFLFVAPLLVPDLEAFGRAMRATLLLGCGVAATLLLNPEFRSSSGRLVIKLSATVVSNPLATGELGGALIMIAALTRSARLSPVMRVAQVAGFVLGAALALMSGSRGQAAFALLIAIGCIPLARKVRSLGSFVATMGGILVVAIGAVSLAPLVLDRFGADRWSSEMVGEGLFGRLEGWLELVGQMLSRPQAWVLGLGYNAFSSYSSAGADMGYSHNVFVDILAELGIPMFAVAITVLWAARSGGLQLFRRWSEDPERRGDVAMLIAFTAYYILIACKQGHLWSSGTLLMFLCLVVRLARREEALDELWTTDAESRSADGGAVEQESDGRLSAEFR